MKFNVRQKKRNMFLINLNTVGHLIMSTITKRYHSHIKQAPANI